MPPGTPFRRSLFFRLLTAALCLVLSVAAAAPPRPNIVSIFSDDHSPNAIGADGRWLRSVNPPPSIDRLASVGILFITTFLDLTPEFEGPAIQQQQDRSAWENMKRMSPGQMTARRAQFGPKDAEFHAAKLEGGALVRWKHQSYLQT